MSSPKREQRLFILPRTELARDVTAFLVDRQARGLSPRTVEYYACKLHLLQGHLDALGVRRVQDITASHLRQFLLKLEETGHNAGGCHCAFRVARTFLRWCWVEYEFEDRNPIAKVHPPKLPDEPLDPVPLRTIQSMLAVCTRRTFTDDRDRAMLFMLLDSGCRAGEFLSLDVGDVNLITGTVIIRRGKGAKWRTCFIGAQTRRALMRYLRQQTGTGALWVTVEGSRLTYAGLRQAVRRRAEKADVPVPSLHSFRRAFCLAMLRGGADILSISRILGHADVGLIARYAKQVQDDLQAVHARASPVDRMLQRR